MFMFNGDWVEGVRVGANGQSIDSCAHVHRHAYKLDVYMYIYKYIYTNHAIVGVGTSER